MKKFAYILAAALLAVGATSAVAADQVNLNAENYTVISGTWETTDANTITVKEGPNDIMVYWDHYLEAGTPFALSADCVLTDDGGDSAGGAGIMVITGNPADPIGSGCVLQRTDYRGQTNLWGLNSYITASSWIDLFGGYELGEVMRYTMIYDGESTIYGLVNGNLYHELTDSVFEGGYPALLMWNGVGYYSNIEVTDDISAYDIAALQEGKVQRLEDEAKAAEIAAQEAANLAVKRANELGFIEGISTPITAYPDMTDNVGGGTKTLTTLNDGVFPVDNKAVPQFDTICNAGRWIPYHLDFFGYEFPANYTVEYVQFYEGGNFFDGGFFADGDIYLEALINGEWVKVDSTVDPEYPVADDQESHFPEYQCFTFTLAEPTACDGIRVAGSAGGSAAFISCSELIVKAVVDAPAVEEPAVEEPAVEEPVVEEPAVEEVVETPAVEEPAEEEAVETPVVEAPQTFDAGIIAAVAAVVSLAGYAVSRKK